MSLHQWPDMSRSLTSRTRGRQAGNRRRVTPKGRAIAPANLIAPTPNEPNGAIDEASRRRTKPISGHGPRRTKPIRASRGAEQSQNASYVRPGSAPFARRAPIRRSRRRDEPNRPSGSWRQRSQFGVRRDGTNPIRRRRMNPIGLRPRRRTNPIPTGPGTRRRMRRAKPSDRTLWDTSLCRVGSDHHPRGKAAGGAHPTKGGGPAQWRLR